jgi:hypothetical protein
MPFAPVFEHERATLGPEPPPAFHLVFVDRPRPAPRASPRALEPCLLVPPLSMRRPRPQADPLLPTRTRRLPVIPSHDRGVRQLRLQE